jgi:hypothetical protein
MWFQSCSAWYAMQPLSETKPAGTRSRFVSSIELHVGSAAVIAIASAQLNVAII